MYVLGEGRGVRMSGEGRWVGMEGYRGVGYGLELIDAFEQQTGTPEYTQGHIYTFETRQTIM